MRHSTLPPRQQRCLPVIVRVKAFMLPALMLLAACGDSSEIETQAIVSDRVSVRATAVQTVNSLPEYYFAGTTRVRQRATLSFQLSGTLAERHVEIGDLVAADQLLARLHNPQLAPARDAAQARLVQLSSDHSQAKREMQRIDELHRRGVVALQDLEQQRARLDSLQAAIDNARADLSQAEDLLKETELRAPFAGTIENVLLEPGEYLQPGLAVMRVSSDDGLEVEVNLPPHLIGDLRIGQTVEIRRSLDGRRLSGQVLELGQSNTRSSLYPLVVTLDDPHLQTGEAVEVSIIQPQDNALALPTTAIMRSAEGLSVFRLSDGRAHRVPVAVSQIQGELAILAPTPVTGALEAGDAVVYAGLTRLTDGDLVEVLP
jgi:membrane fusion protein, multidrug efflux system